MGTLGGDVAGGSSSQRRAEMETLEAIEKVKARGSTFNW